MSNERENKRLKDGDIVRMTPDPASSPQPKMTVEQWLECREFYELMQNYRHAPIQDQIGVCEAYADVKDWIRGQVATLSAQLEQAQQERSEYRTSFLVKADKLKTSEAQVSGLKKSLQEIKELAHAVNWLEINAKNYGTIFSIAEAATSKDKS